MWFLWKQNRIFTTELCHLRTATFLHHQIRGSGDRTPLIVCDVIQGKLFPWMRHSRNLGYRMVQSPKFCRSMYAFPSTYCTWQSRQKAEKNTLPMSTRYRHAIYFSACFHSSHGYRFVCTYVCRPIVSRHGWMCLAGREGKIIPGPKSTGATASARSSVGNPHQWWLHNNWSYMKCESSFFAC